MIITLRYLNNMLFRIILYIFSSYNNIIMIDLYRGLDFVCIITTCVTIKTFYLVIQHFNVIPNQQ